MRIFAKGFVLGMALCAATFTTLRGAEPGTEAAVTNSKVAAAAQDMSAAAVQSVADTAHPAKKRQPLAIKFDVRADWDYYHYDNQNIKDVSAFSGKFLNFILDGNISEQISYHFRHRLNKFIQNSNIFEATDWAYIDYDINKNWRISAGKQVIAIGGYEYDRAPIDVYYYSNFCNLLPACYEFGVSGQYTTNDSRNTLLLQLSNSPYTSPYERFDGLYAYNLMWYGRYGIFNSMYSVNLMEYRESAWSSPNNKKHYAAVVALGNQFNFGSLCLEIDYTHRYVKDQKFFDNFSLVGKAAYTINNCLTLFAKGGYERFAWNDPSSLFYYLGAYDIMPQDIRDAFYGAGLEYYPIKNSRDLRLHAYCFSNITDTKNFYTGIGLRWRLNAFTIE